MSNVEVKPAPFNHPTLLVWNVRIDGGLIGTITKGALRKYKAFRRGQIIGESDSLDGATQIHLDSLPRTKPIASEIVSVR